MRAARNDPCPCGSGKKYKHCCLRQDEARRAALAVVPGAPHAADSLHPGAMPPPPDAPWEADLVPLLVAIGDEADARPVALLVAAGPVVLQVEVVVSPPAEPPDVAALLHRAIAALAARWGGLPPAVHVRHRAVAQVLRREPALAGATVAARRRLPGLDRAAESLLGALGAPAEIAAASSMAPTWRAWRLGDALTAALFHAAADYFRAAPWRHLANEQYLVAELPRGAAWTAVVLGNGGREFGLVLYSSPADLARQLDAPDERRALAALRQPMLGLLFADRAELPPPMRKEILAAGWEVAGPNAYPMLMLRNTPGGGVTPAQAEDLIALLAVVSRFAAEHRATLATRRPPARPVEWRDAATGARLRYDGGFLEPGPPLWEAPEVLTPALPAGPAARPAAALDTGPVDEVDRLHERLLRGFVRHLGRGRRPAGSAQRDAQHAETFLEFLAGYQGVPVTACTEFDLRVFLYDWFPRKVRTTRADARALPAALTRLYGFLETKGLACPWSGPVLADRGRFEERLETFPGGFWWDREVEVWQSVAYEDLDERVMLPDPGLADGGTWGRAMGMVESALHGELQRRWLLWRDQVIAGGVTEPAAVRAELVRQQRAWETAPHRARGGATPAAAIRLERASVPAPR